MGRKYCAVRFQEMLDKDKDGFLHQKEAERFYCREVMNIFSYETFSNHELQEMKIDRYQMGLALKSEFVRGCGV